MIWGHTSVINSMTALVLHHFTSYFSLSSVINVFARRVLILLVLPIITLFYLNKNNIWKARRLIHYFVSFRMWRVLRNLGIIRTGPNSYKLLLVILLHISYMLKKIEMGKTYFCELNNKTVLRKIRHHHSINSK